ncbi:hypothetical protein SAMN02787118_13837 [Streptomyces mirabilis]|uniref:Uncharacterized protein n=1 Tax=Streptomyces mirabilis TaxID=68239 RepID=A0A1I2WMP6_9ACTN|nr:hypothetical protein SAMN02787118_13837 [Streptomyces mirabilis]
MACPCSGSMQRQRMHAPGRHPRVPGLCPATPLHGTRSRLGPDFLMDSMGQVGHVVRAGDRHGRHSPLKCVQGRVGGSPQLSVVSIIVPAGPGTSDDDRIEGGLNFAAPIKDGCERGAPLLPQLMPDIDGFLVPYLPSDCPALDERVPERARQRSGDPKCSSPHGCIPLIHVTHHPPPDSSVPQGNDRRGPLWLPAAVVTVAGQAVALSSSAGAAALPAHAQLVESCPAFRGEFAGSAPRVVDPPPPSRTDMPLSPSPPAISFTCFLGTRRWPSRAWNWRPAARWVDTL